MCIRDRSLGDEDQSRGMAEGKQVTAQITGERCEQKADTADGDHAGAQDIGQPPRTDDRLFKQISGHHSPEAAPIVTAEAASMATFGGSATKAETKAEETPKKCSDTRGFR